MFMSYLSYMMLNILDNEGNTPLIYAAIGGHAKVHNYHITFIITNLN